ncbi:uncharacterized protein LOC103464906 isoform X2 [Poecilia reticulata]|uniref:uncharacterized protein LOC103464906 isoform X2 n=1 Tax=Poecilia reticulata TaxID=8081 RepID=UPI0007EAF9FA|nr:PREDICTED: uncharacterized protein LOC103464906 isoform X2 [Poecilia reticulata]
MSMLVNTHVHPKHWRWGEPVKVTIHKMIKLQSVGFLWIKMRYISLLLFLMLFSGQIQGSTEMIQNFRLMIGITLREHDDFETISWLYNLITIIGTCYSGGQTIITQPFTGKVELPTPTSLIFTSPQKSDSGVYSALVRGDQSNTVTLCNLSFQDPVCPGERRVDVSSNSFCRLASTCSMGDAEIKSTIRCTSHACHQEGGDRSKVTKSGVFLRLYLSNSSIICSHSNQISKTQNKMTIQPNSTCEDQNMDTTDAAPAVSAAVAVLAIIAVAGLLCCLRKKLFCFAQRQTESSNLQMLPPAPQVNGDPGSDRLVEKNTEESSV